MSGSKKVLVLGGTGMLGAMVADVLARTPGIDLSWTARDGAPGLGGPAARARRLTFDAECGPAAIDALLGERFDWIVNAIGIIKPYIKEADPAATERAVRVNALFPHLLAAAASRTGARVLQIATDCVYSGKVGRYREDAAHDALDAYGKTKSLGEVASPALHHLRCSIIGPELKAHVSLLDWFRGQAQGAQLTGFSNHLWNGVTTYHFGRLCAGAITSGLALRPRQHVVPDGLVTKAEMLETFARVFGRGDLVVRRGEAATVIDRTLETDDPGANRSLWRAAGYATPPTFDQMMAELAAHPFGA